MKIKKHPPPLQKKFVLLLIVFLIKVYDLNSDLFTILAFKGS